MSDAARKWVWQDPSNDRLAHPSFRVLDDAEPFDNVFADECEAFLQGRYVEWALDQHTAVPPWAWFNRAAHGSRAEIEDHVRTSERIDQPHTLPDTALVLERALLDRSEDAFREMQRDVLVQLELELMNRLLSPRAILAWVDQAVG